MLLTGGGGVVGQALIQKLARASLICLVHKTPIEAPNAISVVGDLSRERFGLSADSYNELARATGCIVHSAAVTDFSKPEADLTAVNVDGTQRVLDLAAKAGAAVYHLSSAYSFSHSAYEHTPYEISKTRSEEVVKRSGLPATILRPSVIVGDAATGEIARFQGFHFIIGLVIRGLLPFVPATADSYIDFVPQDFVADTVAALIAQRRIGEELWLTAGSRALTIGSIVDFCAEEVPTLIGRPLERPHMVSQDAYERLFRPVFFHTLPRRYQQLMDRAMYMVKYLNTLKPLPSASPQLERELGIPELPDARATLRSAVLYYARQRGLVNGVKP